MKDFIPLLRCLFASIALLFLMPASAQAQRYYQDDVYDGSYQQFYDELDPYGDWINDPQYGYVWVPDAGPDFRPYYTNGHWVNTQYGNTWVSNYPWGWAPFHYGRWTYSNFYGWLWVPGNTWGPAWVSWRSGGGSYGWAPLAPGININIALGGYNVPDYWWTFTPQRHILSPRWQNYCYGPRYAPRYVRNTTIINNTYVYNNNTYITGPRRGDMERAIGRPVTQVAINNSPRPTRSEVRGNSVNMFRPAIAQNTRPTERPRNFRTAEQPIAASATHLAPDSRMRSTEPSRGVDRRMELSDRGLRARQDMTAPRTDRTLDAPRNAGESRVEMRRPERTVAAPEVRGVETPAGRDRTIMEPRNPWSRRADRAVAPAQPMEPGRSWGNAPRSVERPERVQAPEAPQSGRRNDFFNRRAEAQQAQRMRSMERPAPVENVQRAQPMQRTEAPRSMGMPRRLEATAPARGDRQPDNVMGGGRMRR